MNKENIARNVEAEVAACFMGGIQHININIKIEEFQQ
jgi:hypothetical protein